MIARPVWLWLLGAGAHQTRPRFHNFQFMTMVMAMKGRVEAVEVYLFQLSEGFELRARALVHFAPSACRDVRTHRRRRRWEGSPQSSVLSLMNITVAKVVACLEYLCYQLVGGYWDFLSANLFARCFCRSGDTSKYI